MSNELYMWPLRRQVLDAVYALEKTALTPEQAKLLLPEGTQSLEAVRTRICQYLQVTYQPAPPSRRKEDCVVAVRLIKEWQAQDPTLLRTSPGSKIWQVESLKANEGF